MKQAVGSALGVGWLVSGVGERVEFSSVNSSVSPTEVTIQNEVSIIKQVKTHV